MKHSLIALFTIDILAITLYSIVIAFALWFFMRKLRRRHTAAVAATVSDVASTNVSSVVSVEAEPVAISPLDQKLVDAAQQYIINNMSRSDLSVEELSRELGMSRVHLYKRLRQITGKSPIEFIRAQRLERAAELLREGTLNVSEVAYHVGFNNPKYFSRYFKAQFGVVPSAYSAK